MASPKSSPSRCTYLALKVSPYGEIHNSPTFPLVGYLEGSRFYKRNGIYYILATHPSTNEYVLKSSSPFGTYTIKALVLAITPPVTGGNPHQGGLIDTPAGNWYYMAFEDNYPGGRIPIIAPVTWG